MKYALAAVALVLVSGIAVAAVPSIRLEIVIPAFLVLMVLLVIFAGGIYKLESGRRTPFRVPALILVWSITALFVVTAFTALGAVAIGHPKPFRDFLVGNVQPPRQAYTVLGTASAMARHRIERRVASPQVVTEVLTGKNRAAYVIVPPPEGYLWDEEAVLPPPSELAGEKGTCVSVRVDSPRELKFSAELRAVWKAPHRVDGHVTCQVTATKIKVSTEERDVALGEQPLYRAHSVRFSLPDATTNFHATIKAIDGQTETLTMASPSGDMAIVVRQGDTLIVTPRDR